MVGLHARVQEVEPDAWEDPALVQVWGPRFSAYVIAERDRAVFTLGRLPDDPEVRREFNEMADQIEAVSGGEPADCNEVAKALGKSDADVLRYAAPTGRVLIRWDVSLKPELWTVPAPDLDPFAARLELARRYLRVLGPGTADSFEQWAGIRAPRGQAAFDALAGELLAVRTPVGKGWILAEDEASMRSALDEDGPAPARLLPSGDTFTLQWGRDRELLVTNAERRSELWTSRVWPGAVLVDGKVAGTWRRAGAVVKIDSWRRLSKAARDAVEAEATSFPLPNLKVTWLSGT
ncbi:MAG: winged helix DNA-binding domain-containing protein [Acidimicrobiia bacterium]|nr:winged helix DNA-binding domain-containing protein [Acidimicrobiia bacterium]